MDTIEDKFKATNQRDAVIEKMIEDGTIQFINQLYIEFHTTHKKSAGTDGTALTKKMNSLGVKVFGNILGGQEFVAMFG